jgi:hypothetical protein
MVDKHKEDKDNGKVMDDELSAKGVGYCSCL